MLARDLQSIVLYDQDGKFVGVRRPSSKLPIEINGNEILIEDAIGSTGLDLKVRLTDSFLLIWFRDIWPFLVIWLHLLFFYLSDWSRSSYCVCWIWCAHVNNLHKLSFALSGMSMCVTICHNSYRQQQTNWPYILLFSRHCLVYGACGYVLDGMDAIAKFCNNGFAWIHPRM